MRRAPSTVEDVPRRPRPDVPGAMYHVGSRGNNKDVVFFDDHDRRGFLDRLGRTSIRHGWMVLAYCLMGTHYHVVLQVPIGGLSAGMRLLNGGFSHATNRRWPQPPSLSESLLLRRDRERRPPARGVQVRGAEPGSRRALQRPRGVAVEQLPELRRPRRGARLSRAVAGARIVRRRCPPGGRGISGIRTRGLRGVRLRHGSVTEERVRP